MVANELWDIQGDDDWDFQPDQDPLKPFFRWVGGKSRIKDYLLDHFPKKFSGMYLDGTLGSGSIPLALLAAKRISPFRMALSDLNSHLIACWKAVQQDAEKVAQALYRIEGQTFNTVKASKPSDRYGVAARFLYLQARSFNGLWRENSAGHYNVSQDASKTGPLVNLDRMADVGAAVKGVEFKVRNLFDTITAAESGDFIYLDPPYHQTFSGYLQGGFGDQDQNALAEALRAARKRGVGVVASNSDTPLIRELYSDFKIVEVQARRSVSCDAGTRGSIQELLLVGDPIRVNRYRENRCPHGFVDQGKGLCPECDPANEVNVFPLPVKGSKTYQVLMWMQDNPTTNVKAIAEGLGLGGRTVEHVLRRFSVAGMVRRGGNCTTITAAGQALISRVVERLKVKNG